MGSFWDARAREDAFYFVNSTLTYGDPELERFWQSGPDDLEMIEAKLGVKLGAGAEVVEIGCGVGRMTRALAERGVRVRALDVSREMLELAREHNPGLDGVRWVHGDGASLAGIDPESADACISYVVFQHLPDPALTLAYVREMGRVLRPGGWAAFQVSDAPAVHRHRGVAARLRERVLASVGRLPRGREHAAWRGSAIELDELERVAGTAAMAIERVVGRGTQFCFVLLRKGGG